MSKARLLACAAVAALAPFFMSLASPAFAQEVPAGQTQVVPLPQPFGFDRGRNESVATRARPDFDAKGVRFGSFILHPSFATELGTDSNVFYQPTNEEEDITLALKPRLDAASDWNNHSITAAIGLNDHRYQDNDSEDHTDIDVSGEARLDVRRSTNIIIGGRQERLAERRGDPDSLATAAKPLRYEVRGAYVAGVHEFNRARVSLRLDRVNLNYKDAPLTGGGVADQDQRDQTTTTVTGRLEYALSPDTALVAQVAANMRDYKLTPPQAAFDRDSEGSTYLVGINSDISNLIRGELIVGYLQQDYDDPALKDAKGLALEGNIEYFATPLTSFTFAASRRVEETLTTGASSFVSTEASARVDHELRRNILLTAGVGMLNRDFQGASRDDDLTQADIGARFLLNRRMELGARWRYERQQSSGPIADPEFDANRFVVSASVRL